jgi:hypothetical protein
VDSTGNVSDNYTVYRALTNEDLASESRGEGIQAKNPNGPWSLEDHVATGPRAQSLTNDPWIATSREQAVAEGFNSGNGVVKIDLSRVSSPRLDAWKFLPRLPGELAYHYAIWTQEVSVFQYIPPGAIIGYVIPPGAVGGP